ncbi:hypothetical protein BDP27DRAFT_1361393 [Rhodocollybia butyracea]|uniref:Uncharacterized protein n=1 Tax=Rhodocollybia butyracea TaxID=206335 RepID=A0A9P5PZ69_9AGAR|nr:hypothetical protein BDP27DRAFT_1361393 [Rhodocollybia butyracea]
MSVSSVDLKKYESCRHVVFKLDQMRDLKPERWDIQEAYVVISYLLAGSWINMLFYGAEIVLGGFYFLNSRPDLFFRWSTRYVRPSYVIMYTIGWYWIQQVAAWSELCLPSLSARAQLWMFPTTILCTYSSAMVEQIFLTHRFWKITHNKVITFLACLLLIAQVVFHWVFGIRVFVNQALSPFNFNLAITAATLSAATDLYIAMVMLYTTSTIKTNYAATRRPSLLRRLSIQSVTCGITTSASTIVMLSLLATNNRSPSILIYDILGRIYTLTILSNYFILRKPVANAHSLTTEPPAVAQPIVFRPTSLNGKLSESICPRNASANPQNSKLIFCWEHRRSILQKGLLSMLAEGCGDISEGWRRGG